MAKDPYRYFRIEARELIDGLIQGVLALEREGVTPESVGNLLRLAHTLKGAARVVKQAQVAELAHAAESALAEVRGKSESMQAGRASHLLQLLDQVSALLSGLDIQHTVTSDSQARASAEQGSAEVPLATVRVAVPDMDALLRSVSDASVQFGAVRRDLDAGQRLRSLSRALVEQLTECNTVRARITAEELRAEVDRLFRCTATSTERVEGALQSLYDVTHQLRLVPANSIFSQLERTARDAAEALGKQVEFRAAGGDVRLDAPVLDTLRDALAHSVRNAVAHGIESATERVALGKPPRGRIELLVERRGGRVAVTCRDDGRGVDVEAVGASAVARGWVLPKTAPTLGMTEVLELLRRGGGLTTSKVLTEISGRGIGMDVVRAAALTLKGEFYIKSERFRGTSIELLVPVSIASLQGLVVEAAGTVVAIPLDAVSKTLRVYEQDVARSAEGSSIVHEGGVLPFVPLERALGLPAKKEHIRAWSAVVVKANNRAVAIGVERLLGTSSIVLRALPRVVEADSVVAGVSLDAAGNPQLVLDPAGLVAAPERGLGLAPVAAKLARAPILVVDDSLTTRMLEQSILESAGYSVEVANCAEDGLCKARANRYSLFVVDVEMPGMDGFSFVAETRADANLREIPAILVTSRDAVEDRRRGEQAGARAYIVKGEFDQGVLLKNVRKLIG